MSVWIFCVLVGVVDAPNLRCGVSRQIASATSSIGQWYHRTRPNTPSTTVSHCQSGAWTGGDDNGWYCHTDTNQMRLQLVLAKFSIIRNAIAERHRRDMAYNSGIELHTYFSQFISYIVGVGVWKALTTANTIAKTAAQHYTICNSDILCKLFKHKMPCHIHSIEYTRALRTMYAGQCVVCVCVIL